MTGSIATWLPVGALLLASCGAPRLPVATPALAARVGADLALRAEGSAPFVRLTARVTIDAPDLRTTLRGVAIASREDPPRLALQLLPEVGPKALEIVIDGERIVSFFPAADRTRVAPLAGPRRAAFEELLAATFLETAFAPTPSRLRAGRLEGDAVLAARFAGRIPGLEVTERMDHSRRHVELRGDSRLLRGRWEVREVDGGRAVLFAGPWPFGDQRVRVLLEDEERSPLERVPPTVFDGTRLLATDTGPDA